MIVYQVLTRLYRNGKFSDFKKDTFDYLKSFGVSCVWYTGVFRHSSGKPYVKGDTGSPYSICNYYDVNPYFADVEDERLAEFKSLIERTHKAGLKVMTDFVPNHLSPDYSDPFGTIPAYPWCDYDWTDTRKINYQDPSAAVRMCGIVRYWASQGVDAFRCDMVEMVSADVFRYIISEVHRDYPEVIFVGEAYDKSNYRTYLDAGFNFLYDKSGLYDTLFNILCNGASATGISANWQELGRMQSGMLNFLENHDEQRLPRRFNVEEHGYPFCALAVSLLFYDTPFMMYFGQEYGESAPESDNGRTSIFSRNTSLDPVKMHNAIRSRYEEMTAFATAVAGWKNYDLCYAQSPERGFDRDRHFAFMRYDGAGRAVAVLCNFSSAPARVAIEFPEEIKEKCQPENRDGIIVEVGAFDAAVLPV